MAESKLDIGVGDVHAPGATGAPAKAKPVATNRAARRLEKSRQRALQRKKSKAKLTSKAQAGAIAPAKSRGFRIRMTAPDGSRTVIHHSLSAVPGGIPAYYDPGQGQLLTYVKLDKDAALAEPDENRRVWVNVARAGTWAGHPQGAFRMDASVFEALVRNFHNSGVRRLQWDFNHASAMPPSSGNIPVVGTPAQGWIYDIRHDGQSLYVLTEWLPLARQYIENDQYDSASVVIAWDSVDRVTKAKIGPVLRSVALTNEAFITGLQPLAADANGVPSADSRGLMALTEVEPQGQQALSAKFSCHSIMGMLPRLKQTFGLHELATCSQLQAALENYRSHLEAVDGDGMGEHEGVNLAPYSLALRELVNAHAGMDWYAILDIIDELIDAYLDQHGLPDFEDTHGPIPTGDTENSAAATAASAEGVPMAEPQAGQAAASVESAPTVAADAANTTTSDTPASAAVAGATVTAASAAPATVETPALPDPELARLTLENAELKAQLAQVGAQVSALSAVQTEQQIMSLDAEVDAAIETYKDSKGLTPELRPHLLSMLRAAPDAFRATYPAVAPHQRHLLASLTGGGASNPQNPGVRVEADVAPPVQDPNANSAADAQPRVIALSYGALVESLMREHKLSHSAAMLRADSLMKANKA